MLSSRFIANSIIANSIANSIIANIIANSIANSIIIGDSRTVRVCLQAWTIARSELHVGGRVAWAGRPRENFYDRFPLDAEVLPPLPPPGSPNQHASLLKHPC